MNKISITFLSLLMLLLTSPLSASGDFERVRYNNPRAISYLGVGLWAWPMPMDWDRDGDMDLIVSCPDVPFNGTYFFENPGSDKKMPVFKPPVRLGDAVKNAQICYIDGKPRILVPGKEYVNFTGKNFNSTRDLGVTQPTVGPGNTRANQWKYVDYDGDGNLDLICGIGYWGD